MRIIINKKLSRVQIFIGHLVGHLIGAGTGAAKSAPRRERPGSKSASAMKKQAEHDVPLVPPAAH